MQSIKVSLLRRGEASSPLLIHISHISFKSQSKSQCIVYYQIPFSFKYQSIEKLSSQDLFLPDCRLSYKIVNFIQKTQQIVQDNTQIQFKQKDTVVLTNKTKDGLIEIKGTVINKAQQANIFADISLKKIQGYEKFYQYRKKFKTLENITRKIQFSLDHRIKLICQKINSKEEFLFSMDQLKDKEVKNWYIELVKNTKVTIFFEEIVRIGDQSFEKTIDQGSFFFDDHNWDTTYDLMLQFSQYLSITFSLKIVHNKNLSKYQFVALRVFESSQNNCTIKIGNEQTIESLSGCIELNPLLEGKYYDLEYGYLNQNLKQLQSLGQEQKLHKYLQRLTSSKQKYQHFINQKVLDLSSCKKLVFMINENMIQIPVTYLLEGYNSFRNQNVTVKFIVQIQEKTRKQVQNIEAQPVYQQFKPIRRKLYEIKVEDLLNIAQIPTIMQKVLFSTQLSFFIKIKCQSIVYTAEFQILTVKRNEFKNQAKELELKTQYSKFIDGNFIILTPTQNKQTLLMIKSRNLQQFYLVQLTDTTPVTFSISTKRHVIMNGLIEKKEFYISESNFKTKVILSPNAVGNASQKSVLCLDVREIPQQIQGYSFNYKIKYRVSAPKTQSFESVYYDLQVIRVKEDQDLRKKKRKINKNRLSDKVQLQIDNGRIGALTVKQFTTNRSCFIQKHPNLLLAIKLKKMHYNIDLHTFDNDQLIEKQILFNRTAKDIIKQSTLTSQLPTHHFREYDFQAYDQNIKQKVTLHIQIYCSKQPFSIGDQHMYHIKVPAKLWEMSNLIKQNGPKPKIQVQTYLSSKKNKQQLKGQLTHNSAQELLLGHFNASDGISVKVSYQNGNNLIGYSKIRDCIKAKCNIAQDQIGWIQESQWYFAVLNMEFTSFYFLIKMQFNANAQRQSSNESRATIKTRNKDKKQSSNEKGGPDLLAKTMKGFDAITKLKLTKNNLQDELRQLTAKYVHRQQVIVKLKKQISQLDEQNKKKKEEMNSALQINKKNHNPKGKKDDSNKPSIYRSICECGERNPQFMGYCGKCLQKLRQRYEIFFVEFQQKSSEYQKAMFQKFNLRDKIETLKQKISAYKDSMNGDEKTISQLQGGTSIEKQFSRMEEKQLVLQIEELKLEIFDLERERESEFERRAYQMNELEKKIKKQDDEMWEKSQQLNRLNLKLNEIKQQISQNTKQISED